MFWLTVALEQVRAQEIQIPKEADAAECAHVEFHSIETRGIWGKKGKERKDPQQVPHDARTLTTKGTTTKSVYSTSVGSAALPESEASNYTYTKVQRKTTEGTREKTGGRGETRERMKKKKRQRELGLGSRGRQGVETELLVLRL